jgi:16S rRNA processing protein RimM
LSDQEEYLSIAKIIKPRGNRGETAAKDLCDDDELFAAGAAVWLLRPGGERERVKIERSWRHLGRLVLKFEGVETISDAEQLRGCEVQIPFEEVGPASEGEYYNFELVGCEVVEADSGRAIGRVEAVQEPGGHSLLEVRQGEREVLIPFVPQICIDVDREASRIMVRLPHGLEELNETGS